MGWTNSTRTGVNIPYSCKLFDSWQHKDVFTQPYFQAQGKRPKSLKLSKDHVRLVKVVIEKKQGSRCKLSPAAEIFCLIWLVRQSTWITLQADTRHNKREKKNRRNTEKNPSDRWAHMSSFLSNQPGFRFRIWGIVQITTFCYEFSGQLSQHLGSQGGAVGFKFSCLCIETFNQHFSELDNDEF